MRSKIQKKAINHTAKTISVCLAEFLEQNGASYLQLLRSERKKLTEESVHETRVIIRKLEACLELLETLGIHQKDLTKDLMHIRKIHGPLRNIHVELDSIKEIKDQVKSKSFKAFLKNREQKLAKKILNELKHVSLDKHHSEIQKLVDKLLQKDTPTKNEKALNNIVVQNQKISKEFEKAKITYTPKSLKTIHAIRITAKRLRYQSEILKPVISFDNINLRQLKHFQDIFGKIQNNNVLQKSIIKFLHKQPNKGSKSVLTLQTCIAKEQKTLLARAGKMKSLNFSQQTN
jgi:CHAD domain-containing protein